MGSKLEFGQISGWYREESPSRCLNAYSTAHIGLVRHVLYGLGCSSLLAPPRLERLEQGRNRRHLQTAAPVESTPDLAVFGVDLPLLNANLRKEELGVRRSDQCGKDPALVRLGLFAQRGRRRPARRDDVVNDPPTRVHDRERG